jgi:phosphatidylglycerol lysyltransferase
MLLSLAATALSYAGLIASEWWALAVLNKRLPLKKIALATSAAYAASNALGFSLATGGLVRLRFYLLWGLNGLQVAAVTVLSGLAVTSAGLVAAGLAMLATPDLPPSMQPVAFALLAAVLVWLAPLPRSLPFLPRVSLATPPLAQRGAALSVAVIEWSLNGLALFVLLPQPSVSEFAPFLAIFVLGAVVSTLAGAPGGIGVFEAVVLTLSDRFAVTAETAAALLLFRLIYAIGPFSLVALGFGVQQLLRAIKGRNETKRSRAWW